MRLRNHSQGRQRQLMKTQPSKRSPSRRVKARSATRQYRLAILRRSLEKRTVARRGELVYLHTSQAEDFRALEDIGAVLQSEGYVVRDIRFTRNSTQGDVRFFFPGDRRAAERVKSVVEAELQTRGYARRLQLLERDGKKVPLLRARKD